MKKWITSVFCWAVALFVIGGGLFLAAFYEITALLIYGALAAGFGLSLIIFFIGIVNMPKKGE